MATVALVGTLDTKGTEYAFLREQVAARGHDVVVVDAGVLGEPRTRPDVSHEEAAAAAGADAAAFNRMEFRRYLHDQLLRDTDVFSMAHSIEARVPFLDHTVVECAATLSSAAKIGTNGINKPLLVGAVDDPLLRKAGAAA